MRSRHPAFHRQCALVVAALTAATTCAGRARADGTEQVRLHAELGAEYDNNVHWASQTGATEGPPQVGSALGRMVLGLSAADRVGASQDVAFSVLGAAKAFQAAEARSENVAVVDTSGAWRIAAGARTRLGISGSYYDAIQSGTAAERALSGVARDFRSLSPTFRLTRAVGESGTLGAAAGYRWFVYKPARAYDFEAPLLAIDYRLSRETADGAADWEAVASAAVELRRFGGTRLVMDPMCMTGTMCLAVRDPDGGRQNDQFFSGGIDITRTGYLLVGIGYGVRWNRSNSYSETLLRHAGILRLTIPLPLGLYLAARGELVYVTYPEHARFSAPTAGQSFATIEDENRSYARAELTRDLFSHLQLIARYSLYLNALSQGTYQRQTASLSLALNFE
ncbi:MAG: hypothetical protein ABJA82_06675 [Myxococcales bacterium]